ncbi:MAG: hypothetical protein ACOCUL_02105 [Bacteroidota bacterium]
MAFLNSLADDRWITAEVKDEEVGDVEEELELVETEDEENKD